jgi:hypothetical protein
MAVPRLVWRRSSEPVVRVPFTARRAVMTEPTTPDSDRQARIEALVAQLRPAADEALRRMAEQLIDRPDTELFGDIEYRLRDAAHDLAAAAHQTGLEARKKGGTTGPVPSAPRAAPTPGSTPGERAGC